jgi:hypothetical protein
MTKVLSGGGGGGCDESNTDVFLADSSQINSKSLQGSKTEITGNRCKYARLSDVDA